MSSRTTKRPTMYHQWYAHRRLKNIALACPIVTKADCQGCVLQKTVFTDTELGIVVTTTTIIIIITPFSTTHTHTPTAMLIIFTALPLFEPTLATTLSLHPRELKINE